MPSFQEALEKSKDRTIQYKGKTLFHLDKVQINKKQKLLVRRISTNSDRRQGIIIDTKGTIRVDDVEAKKGVVLWEDTSPSEVTMDVESKDGTLIVYNAWQWIDQSQSALVTDSLVHGAAMIIEKIEGGLKLALRELQ